MIEITITRHTLKEWTEKKNLIVKETPTEQRTEKAYGGGSEVMMAKEYAIVDVAQSGTVTTTLLTQKIIDDEQFSLNDVIKAINKI